MLLKYQVADFSKRSFWQKNTDAPLKGLVVLCSGQYPLHHSLLHMIMLGLDCKVHHHSRL